MNVVIFQIPFSLAKNFMGTIKFLRIGSQDVINHSPISRHHRTDELRMFRSPRESRRLFSWNIEKTVRIFK
jgi:hypothetical protein